MKYKHLVLVQIGLFVLILTSLYFLYPKVNVGISGNFVKFDSINSDLIIISKSPEFSDVRYIDLDELNDVDLRLDPGIYYYKPANRVVRGFVGSFVIDSEVGLIINDSEDTLVNVGNVRLKVTKEGKGMTGRIVLDPLEKVEIENKNETYVGGQNEE